MTPNRGTIKKIQIAFITCLEILNLCNMPQPTIHAYRAKGSKWLSEAFGYVVRVATVTLYVSILSLCALKN